MTLETLNYLLNLAIIDRDKEAAQMAFSDEQFSPLYGESSIAVKELLDEIQKERKRINDTVF